LQLVFFEEGTPMRPLLLTLGLNLCSPAWALDINLATEAELDNLRGLGPAFTRRVMAARTARPVAKWPDLMQRVSGMGTRTAQKLSAQGLTVQGQAFPAHQPKLTP
jgi:competence protein ComEA